MATKKKRPTETKRTVSASCGTCGASWDGANAQGSAAHHYDETEHTTVATVKMVVTYGRAPAPVAAPTPTTGRQRERKWRT